MAETVAANRKPVRAALVTLLCWLVCVTAQAAGTCPAIPPRQPMPQEAVPEALTVPQWPEHVAELNARLAATALPTRHIVFIGDSITASWDPAVFNQYYASRAPLLMGISGDFTQGVLQRLPGEWGGLRPRLVVLLIGTNNTKFGGNQPDNVALGIAEIVRLIHRLSPETRVLLLGILPTGAQPDEPIRAVDARVNSLIARCADGQSTFFVDAGPALLDPSGRLSSEISFDQLHLTPLGYSRLAKAIEPDVRRIMGN